MSDRNENALARHEYISAATVEYPRKMLGRALGRNGTAANAAIRVFVADGTIRLQPITQRGKGLQSAWIEIPKHPMVLRQIQALISQALHDIGQPTAAQMVNLSSGDLEE